MTNNRRRWAAMSYPEQPVHLSAEAVARRAKVRIGIRVAKITLPVMLAAGLAAVAGGAGHDSSSDVTATPLYSGDKIALAVRLQLHSRGLLGNDVAVDCGSSTLAVGSVSSCSESGGQSAGASFDVHFLDAAGHFSFTAPGGSVINGSLVD
ncbi:hypothetical protein acdb102_41410 [Acidothermaceae bacterium B102]|nr:hypothetical protein acdb102_41410 [Acidothermaceae bacterium B102]